MELLQTETDHEVLDLFCGLGNFTLPIALRARHVIGLEGDAGLIAKARHNAALNQISNAEFHVADLCAAHDGAPWIDRRFDRVLLDPSRAGAQDVLRYVPSWQAARIVYVSCNPATLARDAGIMVHEHRYRLASAGVMDMFPHTAHVESIAVFVR
jgi:23S rRNA (uracil1939-C5)-methyltransferase